MINEQITNFLYIKCNKHLDEDNEWCKRAEEKTCPEQCLVVDEAECVAAHVKLQHVLVQLTLSTLGSTTVCIKTGVQVNNESTGIVSHSNKLSYPWCEDSLSVMHWKM